MELYLIGAAKSGPNAIGLAESAEHARAKLQDAGAPPLTVHKAKPLALGIDRLALRAVTYRFRGKRRVDPWFDVKTDDAALFIDLVLRDVTDKRKPDKPDYAALLRMLREQVFGTTQEAMAAIAHVNPSTYSRWEKGTADPGLFEFHCFREMAARLGLPWDSEWLFTLPDSPIG